MKIKKFFALLLAMTLCMGVFSVNAYAYVDESAAAESQPVQEEAVLEETPEPEPTEEPMEALTPDGNLTIVDLSLIHIYMAEKEWNLSSNGKKRSLSAVADSNIQ